MVTDHEHYEPKPCTILACAAVVTAAIVGYSVVACAIITAIAMAWNFFAGL